MQQRGYLFVGEIVELERGGGAAVAPQCSTWNRRKELVGQERTNTENGLGLMTISALQRKAMCSESSGSNVH